MGGHWVTQMLAAKAFGRGALRGAWVTEMVNLKAIGHDSSESAIQTPQLSSTCVATTVHRNSAMYDCCYLFKQYVQQRNQLPGSIVCASAFFMRVRKVSYRKGVVLGELSDCGH